MSSLADEAMKLTMSANLSDAGEFSETAKYRKRQWSSTGSQDRTIQVWIDRNPEQTPDELDRGVTPSMRIAARNDSTYGIALTELDGGGGDQILVKQNLGDSSYTTILLPAPESQDAATLTFRIGK